MSSNNAVNGTMYIQLASYLRRIRAIERRKPKEQRLSVPSMKELSKVAGIGLTSISRMANGHTRSLNLDVASAIMTEMWKRGFETEITDILKFDLPEGMKSEKSRANDPWAPPPPPLTRRQHQKYPGDEFVRAYVEESSPDG